jgi:hypothetical protein
MKRYMLIAGLSLAGCFSPQYHNDGLRCADTSPQCPEGYSCGTNGRCRKNGFNPVDAGADQGPSAIVYPPAAVWLSSGGGSLHGVGTQLNLSIGPSSLVVGKASAASNATCNFGTLSSDQD